MGRERSEAGQQGRRSAGSAIHANNLPIPNNRAKRAEEEGTSEWGRGSLAAHARRMEGDEQNERWVQGSAVDGVSSIVRPHLCAQRLCVSVGSVGRSAGGRGRANMLRGAGNATATNTLERCFWC